ncbi:LysR family transcriptional regulator [Nisaea sediminum]|uniref:LysR family transcriptional regulator n=1 Tax=Nisaea sediminum TaxID=2775867 RepID=UPI0018666419|nr:LysR family transcriptional regulator [Nisaea sediminum]
MDWDKLRVFHAVAEAGSFTHAGETLNLSQSAVSRQISQLEDSLKVALFHRHARGLILTEQGETLYRTAREVFAKLAAAEASLSEGKELPRGPLKITTPVAFGSTWLASRIGRFLELYPEITVNLIIDDGELDLGMRQADVAIRLSPPRQPDLIQRHIKNIKLHLYASPSYLKQAGVPQTAEDLQNHRLVLFGDTPHPPFPNVNWLRDLATGGNRRVHMNTFAVNNYYAILRAVQGGVGIAAIPDYLAKEDSSLVRVMPDVEGPQVPAYFVYPEELRHSKRITVLRDFLIQEVAKTQF